MPYYRLNKPEPLSDALDEFLEQFPNKKRLKQGFVLSAFEEVVGERIAEQCKNVHFENTKLVVHVKHPSWRNEIHANRFSIAKRLNERVKTKVVDDIIVRA